jgi:hypothetical protein
MSTIPPQLTPNYVPSTPVTPAHTDATPLAELNSLLSQHNIHCILQAPNSFHSRTQLDKVRRLLTEDNIRLMLHGENAEANAKTLEALGKQLNPDMISTNLESARRDAEETLIKELRLKGLENLMKAYSGSDTADLLNAYHKSKDDVETLGKNHSAMGRMAGFLTGFGSLLNMHRLDSLRTERVPAERQHGPETYSVNMKVPY